MRIGGPLLTRPIEIVGEIGVNHFGSIDEAKNLVDDCLEANVDVVKFQLFKTEALVSKKNPDWFERMKAKELSFDEMLEIREYVEKQGIAFACTPHDPISLRFIAEELDPSFIKIGSGEVNNWGFIEEAASFGYPVVVSTGMYKWSEILSLLSLLTRVAEGRYRLMHANTSYPTPLEETNLQWITALQAVTDGAVGFSDHTEGFEAALVALGLGASFFEKHVTRQKNVPDSQDWKCSLTGSELKKYVSWLRDGATCVGGGLVRSDNEWASRDWAMKSIVAKRPIFSGHKLTFDDVSALRPGMGLSPDQLATVLGRSSRVDIAAGDLIRASDFRD